MKLLIIMLQIMNFDRVEAKNNRATKIYKAEKEDIAIFQCKTLTPVAFGNEEPSYIEMTIDFDFKNKKCSNDFGNISKITEQYIFCETPMISNVRGYILNRYSGELIQQFKGEKLKKIQENYKCVRLKKII